MTLSELLAWHKSKLETATSMLTAASFMKKPRIILEEYAEVVKIHTNAVKLLALIVEKNHE
jgi:hypothetical protein